MTDEPLKRWLQARLACTPSNSDIFEEILYALGAVSISLTDTLDQPILEPGVGETPLWQAITLTALFVPPPTISDASAIDALDKNIRTNLESFENPKSISLDITWLEDKNWERECLEQFEPIRFANKLRVCPSWKYEPDDQYIDILLDPGLAFGTGTHATTHLCLEWLDTNAIQDKSVIDFGCGSGILGIAALKLGAKHVTFIDNDPQAITASQENLRRNKIDAHSYQLICNRDGVCEDETKDDINNADILIANILAQPLIDLSDQITALLESSGKLVLSGLLEGQGESVAAAYSYSFEMNPVRERDGWLCLSGSKKA